MAFLKIAKVFFDALSIKAFLCFSFGGSACGWCQEGK